MRASALRREGEGKGMDDGGEAPQTHFAFWIRKAARDKFQLKSHVNQPPFGPMCPSLGVEPDSFPASKSQVA